MRHYGGECVVSASGHGDGTVLFASASQVNYFVIRNLGVGADAEMSANGGNFVDAMLGDLILRGPTGNSGFAPDVFGGGGRTTDVTWQWVGQGGVASSSVLATGWVYLRMAAASGHSIARICLLLRAGLRIVF